MTRSLILIFSLGVLALCSCHPRALNPLVNETRKVSPVTDEDRFITISNAMVWHDSTPATKGIRLLEGTYALEAVDDSYWYFKSPLPIEMRILQGAHTVDGRNMSGGIAIAKGWTSMLPAAIYIDEAEARKTVIWKLGRGFLLREGRDWIKTF